MLEPRSLVAVLTLASVAIYVTRADRMQLQNLARLAEERSAG